MSAVIAAGVTAVAAAGVSAYGSYKQAQAQKDAAGQLSAGLDDASQIGSPEDLYGKRFIPPEYQDSTSTDVAGDTKKLLAKSLPEIYSISDEVNARNKTARNKATGGSFSSTQKREGMDIASFLKGEVPKDVVDSINRLVAENLGGAFDPSGNTASQFGLSATASDTARRLGLTSLDLVKTGLQLGPAWRASVDSFLYKPQQAASDFYGPAAALNLRAQELASQQDVNRYASQVNIGKAEAAPDPAAAGAKNDALIMAQLRGQAGLVNGQAQANQTQALAGLINAGGQAIGTGINAYRASNPVSDSTFPKSGLPIKKATTPY